MPAVNDPSLYIGISRVILHLTKTLQVVFSLGLTIISRPLILSFLVFQEGLLEKGGVQRESTNNGSIVEIPGLN